MTNLSRKNCVPSREGMPALSNEGVEALLAELDGWAVGEGPRLAKGWKFSNFATALEFVNRIGVIADAEDHHPDVTLGWGRAGVELWTHAAGGLTENDFILAAKIDAAYAAAAH